MDSAQKEGRSMASKQAFRAGQIIVRRGRIGAVTRGEREGGVRVYWGQGRIGGASGWWMPASEVECSVAALMEREVTVMGAEFESAREACDHVDRITGNAEAIEARVRRASEAEGMRDYFEALRARVSEKHGGRIPRRRKAGRGSRRA